MPFLGGLFGGNKAAATNAATNTATQAQQAGQYGQVLQQAGQYGQALQGLQQGQAGGYANTLQNAGALYGAQQAYGAPQQAGWASALGGQQQGGLSGLVQQGQTVYQGAQLQNNLSSGNYVAALQNASSLYGAQQRTSGSTYGGQQAGLGALTSAFAPQQQQAGLGGLVQQGQTLYHGAQLQSNLQSGNYVGALQNAGQLYQTQSYGAGGISPATQGSQIYGSAGSYAQPAGAGYANVLQQGYQGYNQARAQNYQGAIQSAGRAYSAYTGATQPATASYAAQSYAPY